MGPMTTPASSEVFSRTQKRGNLDIATRVILLEGDVDLIDTFHAGISDALDRVETGQNSILKWLVIGAITFGFSAMLGALDLVAAHII